MHESAKRLLDAARSPQARTLASDFGALQSVLGVSASVMTNWKKRGVSKEGALKAESVLGCSAQWVLSGAGAMYPGADSQLTQERDWPLLDADPAQTGGGVNIHTLDIYPVLRILSWEELMGNLPQSFRLKVADNALAPRLSVGDFAVLDTEVTPSPGDGILVRDSLGQHHLRIYRQVRPGEWVAAATNTAYADLSAETYGLSVVAVITGEQRDGRWSGV